MAYLNPQSGDLVSRSGILIIDDCSLMRRSLNLILQEEYRVQTVRSVDEGDATYQSFRPDLVIIDYKMPGKDGVDGIHMLREKSPVIPIICISGYSDPSVEEKVLKAGANAFLRKPLNLMELTGLVYAEISRFREGL